MKYKILDILHTLKACRVKIRLKVSKLKEKQLDGIYGNLKQLYSQLCAVPFSQRRSKRFIRNTQNSLGWK